MQTLVELQTKLNSQSEKMILLQRKISDLCYDLYAFTWKLRPSIEVFNDILQNYLDPNFNERFARCIAKMRNPEIQDHIFLLQKRIKEIVKECQDNCVHSYFFGLSNPFKTVSLITLEEDELMAQLLIQYEIASQDINIKLCVSSILGILDSLQSKVGHFPME
jgi:hypothetical protein